MRFKMRPPKSREILPFIPYEDVWGGKLPAVRIREGSNIYFTDSVTYQRVADYLRNPNRMRTEWSVNGQTFYEMRKGGIVKTDLNGDNGKISVSEETCEKLKRGLWKIIFGKK